MDEEVKVTKPASNVFNLASSIGSGVLGVGANLLSNYLTNRANERMQQRQNAWNLQMWNLNNEYNSPAAQMERLKEAGLNPDLMYGQNAGGASGNSSSPSTGTNPIPKQPFQLDPFMLAQMRLLNAQTYKTNMEGKIDDIQAQNAEEFSYLQNLANLGISQEQIKYLQSEWEKNHKLSDQIDQNILNMKQQWEILHEQINTQVAQTNLLIQQGKKEEAATWLYLAQKEGQELDNKQKDIINKYLPKTLQSQIDLNYANAKNALASANEHEAGAELKREQKNTEVVKQKNINANTGLVKRKTQTEIFVAQQKEQEAKFAKLNQLMDVVNKGASAIKMLTGAAGNVAGAMLGI